MRRKRENAFGRQGEASIGEGRKPGKNAGQARGRRAAGKEDEEVCNKQEGM